MVFARAAMDTGLPSEPDHREQEQGSPHPSQLSPPRHCTLGSGWATSSCATAADPHECTYR